MSILKFGEMPRIQRIDVPTSVIGRIPRTVVNEVPLPVVSGISPPVVSVAQPIVDYPIILLPPGQFVETPPPSDEKPEEEPVEIDSRDLIPDEVEPERPGLSVDDEEETREEETREEETREEETREDESPESTPEPTTPVPPKPTPTFTTEQPTITVAGIEAPLPEAAPLVTAGATAVVTTSVAVTSTIVLNKLKDTVIEPMMKRASTQRKKKIKIKQVKPVLHFVLDDDGGIDIYEYSNKGTKLIDSTSDVERYIRDQVEIDSLYEYDNKIIIDDVIKDKFTKEGAKRFKSLFAPAKSVAKKLGSKFSI